MRNTEPIERHLPWDGCLNIRDIGAYATEDGKQTRWRAVVRSDSLCTLTPAGCASLLAYGVRTIVDLRQPDELETVPHPFARPATPESMPVYLHLSIYDGSDAGYQAALPERASMDTEYLVILEYFAPRIGAVIRAIARAPEGGVLIHCAAGKDRTGLVVAVLLRLVGVPAATIAEDYALSDLYLQPLYEALLRDTTDERERALYAVPHKAPPERMLSSLAHLEQRFGGVQPYLRAAGVSEADMQRIRDRLLVRN